LNSAVIYRSVAAGATAALASGTVSNTLTISGTTASFSGTLPSNVGVGDVIQYDSADAATPTTVAFISGRSSSSSYTVLTKAGATPTAGTALQNWSIYRAYTSLSNALAGTENTGISSGVRNFDSGAMNLVSNNFIWKFALYGNGTTADTTAVTLSGWTTDVDRYVQVYTPALSSEVGVSQRPTGVWDTSKWHLSLSKGVQSSCTILCINMKNVKLIGLQVENTTASLPDDAVALGTSSGGEIDVSSSIFRMNSPSGMTYNNYCFYASNLGTSGTLYFYNNIMYGCPTGAGEDNPNNKTSFYYYNNTVYGGVAGIRADDNSATSSAVYLYNNILYGNGNDIFSTYVAGTAAWGNNFTSDGVYSTQVTLSFNNVAGDDFHLGAGDTVVFGQGMDLSTPDIESNFKFNDDIDGQTRPAGAWDPGADQH
jgi:hypothetical protein